MTSIITLQKRAHILNGIGIGITHHCSRLNSANFRRLVAIERMYLIEEAKRKKSVEDFWNSIEKALAPLRNLIRI